MIKHRILSFSGDNNPIVERGAAETYILGGRFIPFTYKLSCVTRRRYPGSEPALCPARPGRINFRLLHYFRVVAEDELHSGGAAAEYVTAAAQQAHQGAGSQLGVVLFKRTTRSMTLTPAGRTLLRNVERLLIRPTARCIRCNRWGAAKAATWWLALSDLGLGRPDRGAAAVQRAKRRRHLVVERADAQPANRRAAKAAYRYRGLARGAAADAAGLTRQRLASESIAVELLLDHPLAQQESILLAALQNDSFIVLPPHEASLGLYLHNLCLQQGFCRTSLIRSTNCKPAGAGGGGPRHYAAAGQLRPHPVARRPLLLAAAAPPADLYAVYRADSVTPVVEAFGDAAGAVSGPQRRLHRRLHHQLAGGAAIGHLQRLAVIQEREVFWR